MITATLCWPADDATGSLQCQMQNNSFDHDNGLDLVRIQTAVDMEEMKSSVNPYTFHMTGEVPSTLAYLYFSGGRLRVEQSSNHACCDGETHCRPPDVRH